MRNDSGRQWYAAGPQSRCSSIVLVDNTAHGHPHKLPVAVMEGIGAGLADLHLANNVARPHRHRFTIAVTCKHQRVTFHITAP